MSAWWQADPRKLEEVKAALAEHAPRLRLSVSGTELVARGPYELIEAGAVADRYLVEIKFEAELPANRPRVWEIGGRIKRDRDHHINERDGSCCIVVYDEWTAKSGDDSFGSFLRIPFRNFFVSQTHFRKHGEWPFEERAHGLPGMLQSYSEVLGCAADAHSVGRQLGFLIRQRPKGHWCCPCGSGKRLRHCCRSRVNELSTRINSTLAARLLKNLQDVMIASGQREAAAKLGYRHQ